MLCYTPNRFAQFVRDEVALWGLIGRVCSRVHGRPNRPIRPAAPLMWPVSLDDVNENGLAA